MPWMNRLVPFALCLLFLAGPARSQTGPVTAIRCGRLIDVKAGRAVANPVILIENGRITAAGPEVKVPAGARVIDLGPATVLPELIDVHTHLLGRHRPVGEGRFRDERGRGGAGRDDEAIARSPTAHWKEGRPSSLFKTAHQSREDRVPSSGREWEGGKMALPASDVSSKEGIPPSLLK